MIKETVNPFSKGFDDAKERKLEEYYEKHLPAYSNEAIKNLQKSLEKAKIINKTILKDGRIIELREGTYEDADYIHGSVPFLAIDHEEYSDNLRIACFNNNPYEPIGYYFIRKYLKNNEFNQKSLCGDETIIAELKLVYVAPGQRKQHLGSILTTLAFLEVIDDQRVDILRGQVANEKIDSILQKLGFLPSGEKTIYGYNNYLLDLRKDRANLRKIFQEYIENFTDSKNARR